jgi:hypothetical protein
MSAFRFIHTSDMHLGRRFGNLPEEIRGVLSAARRDVVRTLSDAARASGAAHLLVAGDLFDTETPSDQIVRQTLNAMGADPALAWWIIPGNHDSLAAEALWDRVRRDAPANVRLLDRPEPMAIAPRVTLLPAPASRRYPGRDLTAWMQAAATPEGDLRIGLAHGAVQTFASEDGGAEVIPPDRAASAGLSYLALGDWHGRLRINGRTHYSGTPERDRFKHGGRGVCLAVGLGGPGAEPEVTEIPTGRFDWTDLALPLTPGQDAAGALSQVLPASDAGRADCLVRLRARGWVTLQGRLALARAVSEVAPDFCHFEFDESELATEFQPDDLDDIDVGGALRLAAESLLEEAWDEALTEERRRVAEAALNRLYTIVKGETA